MRKQYLKVVSLVMVGMLATGMLLDFNVGKASDTEGGGTSETIINTSQDGEPSVAPVTTLGAPQDVELSDEENPITNPKWTKDDFNFSTSDRQGRPLRDVDGNSVVMIKGFSSSGKIKYDSLKEGLKIFTFPDEIDGKKVVMFDNSAFNENRGPIRGKVIMPKYLEVIDNSAFGYSEISEIVFSNRIRRINNRAFISSEKLSKITFEDGGDRKNLMIFDNAFLGCDIKELILPERTLYLGVRCFSGNRNLSKVVLPKTGLVRLEIGAFEYSSIEEIENLRIQDRGIEQSTFQETKLKNVSFEKFYPDEAGTAMQQVPFGKETLRFSLNQRDEVTGLPYMFSENNTRYLHSEAFNGAMLRSLEISDNIDVLEESGKPYIFNDNPGWITGDRRVALYRKDKEGNFVTDGKVEDGATHIVNPVSVKIKVIDENNQEISLKEGENFILTNVKNVRNYFKKNNKIGNATTRKVYDAYNWGASTVPVTPDLYDYVEDTLISKVSIKAEGNTSDFKIGDELSFELPKIEGYDALSVEGGIEVDKEVVTLPASVTSSLDSGLVMAMGENEDKGSGKYFSFSLNKDHLQTKMYDDSSYKVGYQEAQLILKYKKSLPPVSIVEPIINKEEPKEEPKQEPKEEPKQEPKEEPKTETVPQPPVEPASTVNENIIPPLVEISESSEEEEPEIKPVAVVTESAAISDIEEISFDEDVVPKSDADLEEEGLEILGDEIPQGSHKMEAGKKTGKRTQETLTKTGKGLKRVLAKTGGLQTVFYPVSAIFSFMLLLYGVVSFIRRREKR